MSESSKRHSKFLSLIFILKDLLIILVMQRDNSYRYFHSCLLRRWVCTGVCRSFYFRDNFEKSRGRLPMAKKTAMFNFDLSIFELRYNEVYCHSLKLYPFLSSKIMVSQNLDYCSRKVTHFLKYPTLTVKLSPS